jgi:hypothetical protein
VITVVSWLWKQPGGRTKFTTEHVAIWADMVRRNISMPHRIACVTSEWDLPEGVERIEPPGEFEDVQPKWGPNRPNCYRRLSMFRRDAADIFGERFVCMDLDCVIGAASKANEKFVGSDQAWLAHILGWRVPTWRERDGVFWYGPLYKSVARKRTPRVLFFPGKIKPWTIAPIHIDRFTTNNYRIQAREAA